jgi:type I restriction enzyme, S subunit
MTTFSDSRNLPALSWKLQEPGIRLKYGVNLVNAKAETIFNYIGLENVESWTGRLTQTAELSDLDDEENAATGNKFRSGDVLFGKLRPYLAKAFVAEVDGCCTSELLVLRPIRYDSNYLKYLLLTPDFINLVNSSTYGAKMPRASWDFIGNISLPTLPLESQKSIARFLDRKTAAIDTLIAKKQRLIQLLEEKRTALINQAVTKGLNPNAPMKDSGIPWIGEIPEHWEVCNVKKLAQILRGKFSHRPRNDPKFYGGSYPFIQTGDISRAERWITEYSQTLNEEGYAISKEFPSGTVAMVITGAKTGEVAILGFNACFPDSAIGFFPHLSKVTSDFLYYLFSVLKPGLDSTVVTSTQENLNVERIGSLLTVFPPLNEQKEIVHFLDIKSIQFEKVRDRIDLQIEKLQEYRRSLITAAVTGKLAISEVKADV